MRVLKFGGTSVGTVEAFNSTINIIKEKFNQDKIIVVISAVGGITDKLILASDQAAEKNPDYLSTLNLIKQIHYDLLTGLIDNNQLGPIKNEIDDIFSIIEEKLNGIF